MTTKRVARSRLFAGITVISLGIASGCTETEVPKQSSEAVLGADLEIAALQSNEDVYASVQSLIDESDLIVYGVVTKHESVGAPDAIDDPHASEYFRITLKVDHSLKGAATGLDEAVFVWEGFITDHGAGRVRRVVQDGVSMPDVGDQLVLFLVPEAIDRSEFFGGGITYQVNTLDGILYVDGDLLTTNLHGTNRPAHELSGKSIAELGELLQSK